MSLLFLGVAVISVITLIIGLLPTLDIPIFVVPDLFVEILNLLYYILPMDTLSTIFSLTILITGFRIVLAIIHNILSILEVF